MDLENKKELTAQEVELLNNFQMEELEERLEMKPWLKSDGVEVSPGNGEQPVNPPSESIQPTPPPSTTTPQPGSVPIVTIKIG